MLLSIAQFEPEVIGERIRDKFAASRKTGMWMGGLPTSPPLMHATANGLISAANVISGCCRPFSIPSTMSGASWVGEGRGRRRAH
jgi:hypothetical protein